MSNFPFLLRLPKDPLILKSISRVTQTIQINLKLFNNLLFHKFNLSKLHLLFNHLLLKNHNKLNQLKLLNLMMILIITLLSLLLLVLFIENHPLTKIILLRLVIKFLKDKHFVSLKQ